MRNWIKAARLRTLPVTLAVISVPVILSYIESTIDWRTVFLGGLTILLLQLLSNLANDYGDFKHGADSVLREGPERMVSSGAITSSSMKRAMMILANLGFLLGTITVIGSPIALWLKLIFIGLGLIAIWASIAYTNGSRPYGYDGLGDLSVFLFFGLLAGMGYYILIGGNNIAPLIISTSIANGLLTIGVLNVNNIRDIKSDLAAGKQSVAARLGFSGALIYHSVLCLLPIVLMILMAIYYRELCYLLPVLLVPVVFIHLNKIRTGVNHVIDSQLKVMVFMLLLYNVLIDTALLVCA